MRSGGDEGHEETCTVLMTDDDQGHEETSAGLMVNCELWAHLQTVCVTRVRAGQGF